MRLIKRRVNYRQVYKSSRWTLKNIGHSTLALGAAFKCVDARDLRYSSQVALTSDVCLRKQMEYLLRQLDILLELDCIPVGSFGPIVFELLLLRLFNDFEHYGSSLVQELLQFDVAEVYVLLFAEAHHLRFLLVLLVLGEHLLWILLFGFLCADGNESGVISLLFLFDHLVVGGHKLCFNDVGLQLISINILGCLRHQLEDIELLLLV